MAELLRYGREHSEFSILEGIMYDEWYRSLFELANELYGSNVYAYYFDLSFEETVRRHNTRNREFGEKICADGGEKKIFLQFSGNRLLPAKWIQTVLLKKYTRI